MEIHYDEKIVAFIDVLGFSNLVFNDRLEPISDYYKMILTDFKAAASKNELNFLMISDSIVVHAPLSKSSLFAIFKVLNALQQRLLIKGILVRGGISFGKLYVSEEHNIIVGPGLINAYNLEKLAKYPRIIIDRKFITLYWVDSSNFLNGTGHLIRLTSPTPYENDFPFLDFGQAVALLFQPTKFDAIVKLLKDNYYNNEHIEKIEWVKSLILDSVKLSLNYLKSKVKKSRNEPKRISLLTSFIKDFEKL